MNPVYPDSHLTDPPSRRKPRNDAATGVSAAGVRALSAQMVAFYFRAPIKAFFRTRVEYVIPTSNFRPRILTLPLVIW